MSEFRQDPVTRDWVIVAPERARRPHAAATENGRACPFCPESVQEAGAVVARVDDDRGRWLLLVIDNRFPILTPAAAKVSPETDGPWHRLPGRGCHEIVIDSPEHDATLGTLEVAQLRRLLGVYAERSRALARVENVREVVVFRNQGEQAGASLRHPHSQIVATPVISPVTRRRTMDEIAYFDDHGRCAVCAVLEAERQAKTRLICESACFASFAPFASRVSYETRIVPLRHRPRFEDATRGELDDLATHLHRVFTAMEAELANPDHNFVIASPPLDLVHQGANHWFIEILPRLAVPAGFEIGSGIEVTASAPEATAAALRSRLPRGSV